MLARRFYNAELDQHCMLAIELTYNTSMDFRLLIRNVLLTSHQRLCAGLVLVIQQQFLCRPAPLLSRMKEFAYRPCL